MLGLPGRRFGGVVVGSGGVPGAGPRARRCPLAAVLKDRAGVGGLAACIGGLGMGGPAWHRGLRARRGPGGSPGLCGTEGSHHSAALPGQLFSPSPKFSSSAHPPVPLEVKAMGTSSLSFLSNLLRTALLPWAHC